LSVAFGGKAMSWNCGIVQPVVYPKMTEKMLHNAARSVVGQYKAWLWDVWGSMVTMYLLSKIQATKAWPSSIVF
jgi:hypothetical protein